MLKPRLIRLNRKISWLLVLVSGIVLLTGYTLTILDLEGAWATWGHRFLGGAFALLFLAHMLVSVVLVRFDWGASIRRTREGTAGSLTWLRLAQRVSGWVLVASAGLVLLSGLDWFKLGTGRLVQFSSHIRFDLLLGFAIPIHAAIGLNFALMRRRLRRKRAGVAEPVSAARREAIGVLAGMALSFIAVAYLDRIARVTNIVEKIERLLPPDQYEVRALRTLHYGPVPPFDEGSWTLKVDGLVGRPLTLTYREVKGLPSVVSVSDFHCVTGWTKFRSRWEGVAFETIQEMAEPLDNARYVLFLCEGDYTTSMPLQDLNREGILLAYRLDGKDLQLEHGGPLRLVVPHKYAYKSAKWVRRITFLEENELGFWEVRGYSDTADPFTNDRYSKLRGTTN